MAVDHCVVEGTSWTLPQISRGHTVPATAHVRDKLECSHAAKGTLVDSAGAGTFPFFGLNHTWAL